jgi:HAD superfamily hydrolase (TIGR01509 family)
MFPDTGKYRNLIFDFGGVIINIDYQLLISSFARIGLPHFEAYFSQANQRSLFDDYEKGLISSAEFRKKLKEHCKEGTTDDQIDEAWNAMLLDLPEERLDLLMKLRKKYRTFLLSNTNEIHIQFIYRYLERTYGIKDLSGYFEKIYLSYEMGMKKPDAAIFEKVIHDERLDLKETLFIDDSVQHIEAAGKLGIHAYLLDVKKQDITELFDDDNNISLSVQK